ncbi:hypothetical protein QBC39DRAFT_142889 [Podospora conica]|nr:hypothetical protein QBC39DRAFT_142889 [Schizothecium conicum]
MTDGGRARISRSHAEWLAARGRSKSSLVELRLERPPKCPCPSRVCSGALRLSEHLPFFRSGAGSRWTRQARRRRRFFAWCRAMAPPVVCHFLPEEYLQQPVSLSPPLPIQSLGLAKTLMKQVPAKLQLQFSPASLGSLGPRAPTGCTCHPLGSDALPVICYSSSVFLQLSISAMRVDGASGACHLGQDLLAVEDGCSADC